MSRRGPRLPIHLWFGVALVVIAVFPALAAAVTYLVQDLQQQQRAQMVRNDVRVARAFLVADAAHWSDRSWPAAARARLAGWGLGAQVTDRQGHLVLETAPHVPRGWNGEKFVVSGSEGEFLGGGVIMYPMHATPSGEGPLIAGLLALLGTLAIIGWVLGRAVVRPLAAMSRAARGVSDGHLDVRLPRSGVKEVAEVAAALELMSAGLHDALAGQEALEQERRLFIGAIAHDLRTPLFTLRSYLRGLQDGLATTPEKAERYVAVCQEKADALERLVTDLFAYARLEYLEQAPQLAPIELGKLLREVVEDVRPAARDKDIALFLDGPAEPCPLAGDSDLLIRAMGNLLDNALRHTPGGGQIHVRWKRENEQLVFGVEDTGPGIATADLPHLFTPLYRGETSRNRRTGGAGLGLAIARGIVRAHGGDLVAANSPAGGAVLTGTLALRAGNRASWRTPAVPEHSSAPDSGG